jgi:heme exporter protein A
LSEFSIEARGVSCERDQRLLLDDVNCAVGPGEVLQIAGANGSGKTTLLRILVGISTAYDGQVLWCGQPIAAAAGQYLSQLLYLGHNPGVTLTLSALENLRWYFQLNQTVTDQRMREALAALGLDGYEDVPAYRMSAGQQRRIALARLLISDAPLWILDEPFTAIDRGGVQELEQLICRHARQGGAVILTTHHALNLDVPFDRLELAGVPC